MNDILLGIHESISIEQIFEDISRTDFIINKISSNEKKPSYTN